MSRITEAVDEAEAPERPPAPGMVVTSHPQAVAAGIAALDAGGTAVDAAVTAAAALGVVDPMSCSLGGDTFALVYEARTGELHGINGSGPAPMAATLEDLARRGHAGVPERGPLPITVPGAIGAWGALLERFGRRSFADALTPAAVLAREGFTVTPVVARDWQRSEEVLRSGVGLDELLPGGRTPRVGQVVSLPGQADTLEHLASTGPAGFYGGPLAQRIDAALRDAGGWLRESDLAAYQPEWVAPLTGTYRGHAVHELPPNGQGIVVLEALALLEEFPLGDLSPVERTHLQIEALKLAFADADAYVGDPARSSAAALLQDDVLEPRLDELDARRRRAGGAAAPSDLGGDTVYVAATDREGNACSLIHSVFMHFGAAFAVDGVVLQNRGALFRTDPAHPGALGPGRRSYHTIIPAMVERAGQPWLVVGVVGGFQQPQAQVQLLTRLIDGGEELQPALDAPRFRWTGERNLRLEEGTEAALVEGLRALGHELDDDGSAHGGFGGAQAILHEAPPIGATDRRKDGVVGVQTA